LGKVIYTDKPNKKKGAQYRGVIFTLQCGSKPQEPQDLAEPESLQARVLSEATQVSFAARVKLGFEGSFLFASKEKNLMGNAVLRLVFFESLDQFNFYGQIIGGAGYSWIENPTLQSNLAYSWGGELGVMIQGWLLEAGFRNVTSGYVTGDQTANSSFLTATGMIGYRFRRGIVDIEPGLKIMVGEVARWGGGKMIGWAGVGVLRLVFRLDKPPEIIPSWR